MPKQQENKGLETLQVWQRAVEFTVRICKEVAPILPADEKWLLSQQIRRSAQSIPANIAEGYGRYHYLDNIRFCYIARGSLEETFSHLVIANRLNYISDQLYQMLAGEVTRLRQMLNGYIHFLKTSKMGESELPARSSIHETLVEYDIFREDQDDFPDHE